MNEMPLISELADMYAREEQAMGDGMSDGDARREDREVTERSYRAQCAELEKRVKQLEDTTRILQQERGSIDAELLRVRRALEETTKAGKQLQRDKFNLETRVAALDCEPPSLAKSEHPAHRYRDFLRQVAGKLASKVLEKDVEYGGSWRKRGGQNYFYMLMRKVDRLEEQAGRHNNDLFAAMEQDARPEGIKDDLLDLMGYCLLGICEVEARSEAKQPVVVTQSSDADDEDMPF